MPENNPTPTTDAELAELKRLRSTAPSNKYLAALHNAFPGLLARLKAVERERERWKTAYAEEVSGPTRKVSDARMKREGAVMKLLDMSLGGFAWDETSLRHEAEAILLDAGEHSRYEAMVEAAQRLREEGK